MNERNDTAMSRKLQTDDCSKLLNFFEEGIHMTKAMNPVPIYHKITLTIDETSELSSFGIIESMPWCASQTTHLYCSW